jgi:ribosomal protein S18 acetylase RimI-like enzyme
MEGARFERRDGYTFVTFPTLPIPSFNGVWPDEDSAATALPDALAEIEASGIAPGVLIRNEETPAVVETARVLGLTAVEHMPGMVANAGDLVESAASELEIVHVESADGFAQALAIATEGFGAPEGFLTPLYMPEVTSLDGYELFLGRVDGRDVTTAASYVVDDDVGVFNVATPSQFRGRGHGAAITAHAVHEGFANGAELAYLQSSTIGESVYRRLGFREVVRYDLLSRPAEVSPTS